MVVGGGGLEEPGEGGQGQDGGQQHQGRKLDVVDEEACVFMLCMYVCASKLHLLID